MAFVLHERARDKGYKSDADDGNHDEQHVKPIVAGEDAQVHGALVV